MNEAEIQAGLICERQAPPDSATWAMGRACRMSALAGLRTSCRFRHCSPTIRKVYLASQTRALAQVLCRLGELLLDTRSPTPSLHLAHRLYRDTLTNIHQVANTSLPGRMEALKTTVEEPVSLGIFTFKTQAMTG